MTVCKFWREGHCWHGGKECIAAMINCFVDDGLRDEGNCWYDHYESSDEENESDCQDPLKPAQDLPVLTISEPSTPAESESIPGTPDTSTVPQSAFSLQREYSSTSEAATSSPHLSGSAAATQAISPPSQHPKTSTIALEMTSTAVATDPPERLSPKLERGLGKVQSGAEEATMLKKIANLEETVRRLEASADPERQSLENDLLRDELHTLSERNRDLQVDAKSVATREAELRVTVGALKARLESVEKGFAALLKNREWEREESRADRMDGQEYLNALEGLISITTKANEIVIQVITAAKERSESRGRAMLESTSKPPPNISIFSMPDASSSTVTSPQANSSASNLFSSLPKPPVTPAVGLDSASTPFFGPKKPLFDGITNPPSADNPFLQPKPATDPFSHINPDPIRFSGKDFGLSTNPPPWVNPFSQPKPLTNIFSHVTPDSSGFSFNTKKPLFDLSTNPPSTANPYLQPKPFTNLLNLPPLNPSAPSSIAPFEAWPGAKRKVEETNGNGEEQAESATDAAAGINNCQAKKAKTAKGGVLFEDHAFNQ